VFFVRQPHWLNIGIDYFGLAAIKTKQSALSVQGQRPNQYKNEVLVSGPPKNELTTPRLGL
jgi:hypothetical protein